MSGRRSSRSRTVQLARAYEVSENARAYRVLVDRIWPRGITKERLALDEWAKDLAPSTKLRQWFHHDPERWDAFRERYFRELDAQTDLIDALMVRAGRRPLLLIYGAHDPNHNNAVSLKEYLSGHASRAT